jgi:hypothetical protein
MGAQFDIDGNGMVNAADIAAWRTNAGAQPVAQGGTACGAAYKPGDFNLNGVVDGTDFGLFNSNKFTANTQWSKGNANGDGVTDGTDFGIFNANKFTGSCILGRPGSGLNTLDQAEVVATAFAQWSGRETQTTANRTRVSGFVRGEQATERAESPQLVAPPAAVTAVTYSQREVRSDERKDRISAVERIFSRRELI